MGRRLRPPPHFSAIGYDNVSAFGTKQTLNMSALGGEVDLPDPRFHVH